MRVFFLGHRLARWAGALFFAALLVPSSVALAQDSPLVPRSATVEPLVRGVQTAPSAALAVLAEIERALGSGQADALTDHFADRVEVTLPGSSKLYSRAQATYVLAEMLRDRPPVRVALQAPSASSGQWLAQGTYLSADATEPLRLYVRLRADASGTWQMRELRLDARP